MPMRVAMLASECEPWAKTGGLADVVDALARALGELDGSRGRDAGRRLPAALSGVPEPAQHRAHTRAARPGPAGAVGNRARSPSSTSPANGYRLRLVDHPAAFDRDGFYGDDAGDYPDNAWRFGLFCRTALETLRADGRPLDVLHLHDWHTGAGGDPARRPLPVRSDRRRRGDPDDAPQPGLPRLDARGRPAPARPGPGDGVVPPDADGIDLLLSGHRARRAGQHGLARVSPAEALTPEFGMGLDGALRAKGDRFFGILNGLDTTVWDPATDADLAAPYSRDDVAARRPAGRTC